MAPRVKTVEMSEKSTGAVRKLSLAYRFTRWLKSFWSLNLLLGVISLGTILFIWEFAKVYGAQIDDN